MASRGKASLFGHTGLLGPIGLRRLHALAAGIVLASSVGILLVSSGILRDAYTTVAAKHELVSLAQYQGPHSTLDQEISQLSVRIDAASDSPSYTDSAGARTVSALETILPATPANAADGSDQGESNLF
jgi:hypothetical protein